MRRRIVTGMLAVVVACTDGTGPVPRPSPILVSNPHVSAVTPVSSRVSASLHADGATVPDTTVYVGLEPGTAPTGTVATVRVAASGAFATTVVQDGGFDPVPVTAEVGDTVTVVVRDAAGAQVFEGLATVPPIRRLVVVRTDPPPGKRDQPLNSSLVVVFSEPVASSSLTESSVQLSRGTTPVAGTISVLQGSGTTVAFTPTEPLAPNTDYVLLVTTAVTDLDGEPLDKPVTVPFTTGVGSVGAPASISVLPNAIQMTGGTYQLTGTVRDGAGNVLVGQPVTWASSDSTGLAVSATGLVTALASGSYQVTATSNGLTATAQVVVAPGLPASVTISPAPATVGAQGDTIILKATVHDARGRLITYPSMTWTSSAPNIATVTQSPGDAGPASATVTGVNLGEVTITAKSGTASGTASITVTTAPPTGSVTVTPSSASLLARMTTRLSVTVRDVNGRVLPGRTVAWSTDAAGVATVNATGLVTAVDSGSASVIATSGGVSDTALISVLALHMGSVTAGLFYTCGLATNGAAYCWGQNVSGQLGDGTDLSKPLPTAVTGGLTFAALSVGASHTCGLTPGGAAYCWGNTGDSTISSAAPVAVTGGLTFSSLVTGYYHTCGLTVGGAAYCWGTNYSGQLGDGSFAQSAVPILVAGGHTFSTLSARGQHTCGLEGGAAYCWGENGSGQLGDGTTVLRGVPVAVIGGFSFTAIAAGEEHTCAIRTTGAAYCWGANSYGQLGNGTTRQPPDTLNPGPPTPPGPVLGGHTFVALSGGAIHTCGVTATGTAYCWGSNASGQLGDATTIDRLVPAAVSGGFTLSAISAGGFHTCGFATSGVAFCWGENGSGQLGDGSKTSSIVPVRVAGQP